MGHDSRGTIGSSFQNFYFRNRVVSELLGDAYSLCRKLRVEFCVIFIKAGISGKSLDFFEAKYGRIYGREWLMCVITVNQIIC